MEIGELDVFLEERLPITVSRGRGLEMRDVEQSLEEGSDHARLGAGAILRALLHQVVNDYVWGLPLPHASSKNLRARA